MSEAVPYENLTPDVVLRAAESCGHDCTGSILALASYENRVYQIATTEGFVVAKFYRPGRWSTEAILEEHDFALELAGQEIPVVPPLVCSTSGMRSPSAGEMPMKSPKGGLRSMLSRMWCTS